MGEPQSVEPPTRRVLAFGAILWLTFAFFIPAASWNPNARFDLTLALVHHQQLNIDAYHANTGDKAHFGGHYYCDKAPGVSLLAVPAYAVFAAARQALGWPSPSVVTVGRDGSAYATPRGDGRDDVLLNGGFRWGQYTCTVFTSGLAGAALGMMLMAAAYRNGRSLADSTAIAIAATLGTLLFPYSTSFYGHVPAAALAFGSFVLLAAPGPKAKLFFAGSLAAAAVACEWPAALIALALTGFIVHQHSWRALAPWCLGAALPALGVALYNHCAFGSVLGSGYTHLVDPRFAAGMSRGLMGITWPSPRVLLAELFGRSRGLFYTGPVLLLATAGLWRPTGATRLLASAVVASFLLLSAGYFMWWGGAAFGPRHVIPALPFWCLGLLWAWPSSTQNDIGGAPHRARDRWHGHLTFACVAWSVANMTLGTAVGFEAPLTTDLLFRYTYPLAVRGQIPFMPGGSNLGRLLGLPGPLSLLPLVLVWGAYISWVWRWLPLPPQLQPKD
ncbi:MAG: hypothetical protein SF187_16490 [Deltaproteobacteria bacterium]|nr:hypothetical protein [Deltaproteobacteria bacterium]